MQPKRLLMISTDRLLFEEKSAVRARQIEYAIKWEEVHIIIFNTRVDSMSDFAKSKIQISPNCWIYSTESSSKFLYPLDAIKLGCQIITEHKITEITCQDASLTAMVGLSLKKKFNIPLEIQIHEDFGSPYYTHNIVNKIRKILAQRYLPQADKIRVVSDRIKNYVEKLLEEKGRKVSSKMSNELYPIIEVRPIAIDTEAIKNTPILIDLHRKYQQFDKIVLMASRLEKEKNIELAIRAWPEVVKIVPKAGLIIVGKGSQEKSLHDYSMKFAPHNIIFDGWGTRETLISYYKTADLFLNTSLFEGYGMTLVEAEAAGCPVISTDVGIAKRVGAIIVENDSDDVADKIVKVIQNGL
jgi:glycosyltransferase involved in cell wall biosynthesis